MADPIQKDIPVETLIEDYPQTVKFMVDHGLPCFVCGEPTWGTFEEMARRHGKTDPEIITLITEMNSLIQEKQD